MALFKREEQFLKVKIAFCFFFQNLGGRCHCPLPLLYIPLENAIWSVVKFCINMLFFPLLILLRWYCFVARGKWFLTLGDLTYIAQSQIAQSCISVWNSILSDFFKKYRNSYLSLNLQHINLSSSLLCHHLKYLK